MEGIKPGDVVRLKTGGPRMTVGTVGPGPGPHPDMYATCLWFEAMQKQEAEFPLVTLVKLDELGSE